MFRIHNWSMSESLSKTLFMMFEALRTSDIRLSLPCKLKSLPWNITCLKSWMNSFLNIARLQKTSLNTSHWVSRCPVDPIKRLFLGLVMCWVLSKFEFHHNLSLVLVLPCHRFVPGCVVTIWFFIKVLYLFFFKVQ